MHEQAIAEEVYRGESRKLMRSKRTGKPQINGVSVSPLEALEFALENGTTDVHLIALWDDVYQMVDTQPSLSGSHLACLWAYAEETIRFRWDRKLFAPRIETLQFVVSRVVACLRPEGPSRWKTRMPAVIEREKVKIDGAMFRTLVLAELKFAP